MKNLILLISCIAFIDANAQKTLPKDPNGKITFTEVIQVKELSKDQLYSKANKWFSDNYKSSSAIELESEEAGKMESKGIFKVYKIPGESDKAGGIYYKISVETRDGRYKYTITNFVHKDHAHNVGSGGKLEREEPLSGYAELPEEVWGSIKDQAYEQTTVLIESLKKGMQYVKVEETEKW